MIEKQGFRDFDLPVGHLEVGSDPQANQAAGNWIPPYSNDPEEIAELRGKPGLLIKRRQNTGTQVEARILELLHDRDVPDTFFTLLGGAAFNSAFYEHAAEATDVTRRRLKLAVANEIDPATARSSALDYAAAKMSHAGEQTAKQVKFLERTRLGHDPKQRKKVGIAVGDAGIVVGAIPRAEQIANAWDEYDRQRIVREGAMAVRRASVNLRSVVGVYPSIAQLGDRRSPVSNHIANNRLIYGADANSVVEQAQEEVFEEELERRRAA
jgi:hypothetical protein